MIMMTKFFFSSLMVLINLRKYMTEREFSSLSTRFSKISNLKNINEQENIQTHYYSQHTKNLH